MQTLTEHEQEVYTNVWTSVDRYAENSPGERFLPLFLQMTGDRRGTVLDAGCGSGKGAVALAQAGFTPTLCDITPEGLLPEAKAFRFHAACLWQPLRPQVRQGQFDWVYCTDVLEHIPVQFTMLVVDQLLRMATQGVFLSICLERDLSGIYVGRPLHLTVQPFTWWRDSLAELGQVVEARDLIPHGVFLVRAK